MATIKTVVESSRGCGYRKPGGLYLMGGQLSAPCGIFPHPVGSCPCCGAGIKFSRGFSWVTGKLFQGAVCKADGCTMERCAFGTVDEDEEFGLMWVGGSFYNTPAKFMKEAGMAGISKRIAFVPRKLEIGVTWVLLAHLKAITHVDSQTNKVTHDKGIFAAFKPTRIEYVVKGDENDDDLESMEKRGITLVKVVRDTDAQTTFDDVLKIYNYRYLKPGNKRKSIGAVTATSKQQARSLIRKEHGKEFKFEFFKFPFSKTIK